MKVFVYFNLHKHMFSVKALEGENKGKVVAHRLFVVLQDATFKVSEAGRQRVLREQRKNVHAGVVGIWHDDNLTPRACELASTLYPRVSYNPYKGDGFVVCGTGAAMKESPFVFLRADNAEGRGYIFAVTP